MGTPVPAVPVYALRRCLMRRVCVFGNAVEGVHPHLLPVVSVLIKSAGTGVPAVPVYVFPLLLSCAVYV